MAGRNTSPDLPGRNSRFNQRESTGDRPLGKPAPGKDDCAARHDRMLTDDDSGMNYPPI